MRVRVRFFAALRERLGPGGVRAVASGATAGDVWRAVAAAHPDVARLTVRLAVNQRYVEPTHELAEDDELAVFPPVSGGR
jgi:molybdopterin converting factor subunit 1